jgi:REP element-mobilizing transposase RayT
MGRAPREETPGYYHVTMRGNAGIDIYGNTVDRDRFLTLLGWISHDEIWTVHAWCLMSNHFHLIVEIRKENLSAGMHRLAGRYARWFNETYDRTGHLFERRYSAKRIEGEVQLRNTAEYILANPIRAGLCTNPWDWRWLGGDLLTPARPAPMRIGSRP